MQKKLVVIGNGMAGMRTVEELLRLAPDAYQITVFGSEPFGNYNRIMLSPVLAGEKTVEEILIHDFHWYKKNQITLHCGPGKAVINVDRKNQTVTSGDGTIAHYDRLLLATGSLPVLLPVPGTHLDGVMGFRDIHDVHTMLEASQHKKNAVVIGGGLLGLEAASGLTLQGMRVTVIHRAPTLMNRQLDETAASLLKKKLEADGLSFRLNANTQSIDGNSSGVVKSITLDSGEVINTDLVVMTAGISPNISLAKGIGLHCERGVVVNDTLQTYDPKIYAVGECIQHRNELFGLVAPIWEQAKVCANHLAGHGIGIYESLTPSTKLKVTGIDLFSAGNYEGGEDTESIIYKDLSAGIYRKLVILNDQVVGIVMIGDTSASHAYFELLKSKSDISAFRTGLIFGQTSENAA